MHRNTKAFQENLSIICDELHLAKLWGKASILLTVHKSVFSQQKLKIALGKELDQLGYHSVELKINQVEGNFVDHMLAYENNENIVFYISNLGWGGGKDNRDGFRILNLYRESIIENKLKTIFFLTLSESSNLPGYAPDFWAFRHRVLEFVIPRSYGHDRLPSGLMLWHSDHLTDTVLDPRSRIINLVESLASLPQQVESVALRLDLTYELGFLYWYTGDYARGEKIFADSIALAKQHYFSDSLVKLQNGLAILYFELEKDQSALGLVESSIALNPQDCLSILNQAVLLFVMKKKYQALLKGKKAVSFCRQNSRAWNALGFLYYFAGNFEDALICFQTSNDISPQNSTYLESVCICYLAMGLRKKALVQLEQAEMKAGRSSRFGEILKQCILGNSDEVSLGFETLLAAGEFSGLDLARNPLLIALEDVCL